MNGKNIYMKKDQLDVIQISWCDKYCLCYQKKNQGQKNLLSIFFKFHKKFLK